MDPCGIFISCDHPFLGGSPNVIVFHDGNEMGLVEVKCPDKHREHTLEEACRDKALHLHWEECEPQLKKTHGPAMTCMLKEYILTVNSRDT